MLKKSSFVLLILLLTVYTVGLRQTWADDVSLSGKITDGEGNPVANAIITANDQMREQHGSGMTTADGSYRMTLTPGTYVLEIRPSQGSALPRQHVTDVQVHNDSTLNITLKAGVMLSGQIKQPGGKLVSDVSIDVFRKTKTPRGSTRTSLYAHVRTSADGAYCVALMPGTYELEIQPSEGSGLPRKSVSDVEVTKAMTLDIMLEDGVILSGQVTASGKPVADARIHAVGRLIDTKNMQKYQSGGHERKPMMLKVSTSADGTYHIALMPGKYTLWIEPPWGSELPRKTIRDVQIKADMTLDIVWKGTILSGKLTDTDGNPVGNVNIEISGENSGQTQSTKDGTYRVELGPSDYPTGAVRDGIIRIHIHPPAASGLISRTIGIERVKADRTLDITLLRTQMTADGSENAHTSEGAKGEEATELITGKVVATIPLQHSLDRALITPDSRFVYVMGCHDNVVSVIDTSSNKVVKTLAAGIAFEDTEDLACYMVVTPDSRWVYVNYIGATQLS